MSIYEHSEISSRFIGTCTVVRAEPLVTSVAGIRIFDSVGILATKVNLANAYYHVGRIRQSYQEYQQAYSIAQEVGDRNAECLALEWLLYIQELPDGFELKTLFQSTHRKAYFLRCRKR